MKKKVYIVIIVCVLLFIVGIGIVIKLNMRKEVISQTAENLQEESFVDIIENKVEEEIIQSETKTEEIEEEQVSEIISEEIIFNNDIPKEEIKEEEPIIKEQEVVVETPSVTIPIQKEEVQDNVIVQENIVEQEIVQEVIKQEVNETKEEFKINNVMIQNLTDAINNNPSQLMDDYGYTIVVDSSIVERTNQFTYVESRVADKLVFKCGTIKIYARDYYKNGVLMWTECFVI